MFEPAPLNLTIQRCQEIVRVCLEDPVCARLNKGMKKRCSGNGGFDLQAEYSRYSHIRKDSTLSFDDFVCLTAIRVKPFFVFEYPELAADILSLPFENDLPESKVIQKARFIKFSQHLYPIVSKNNAKKVFHALRNESNVILWKKFVHYILCLRKFWNNVLDEHEAYEDEAIQKAVEGERILFAKVTGLGRGSCILTDSSFIYKLIVS